MQNFIDYLLTALVMIGAFVFIDWFGGWLISVYMNPGDYKKYKKHDKHK